MQWFYTNSKTIVKHKFFLFFIFYFLFDAMHLCHQLIFLFLKILLHSNPIQVDTFHISMDQLDLQLSHV